MEALPSGLRNLGNTCFMNAGVQCLLSISKLQPLLKSLPSGEGDSEFVFARAIQNIAQQGSKLQVVAPRQLQNHLKSVFPVYQKGREHDVLEFIMAAFDCIDREFKQWSIAGIDTIIGIEFGSDLTCKNCNNISTRKEVERVIVLDVEGADLQSCFVESFKPEVLQGSNAVFCSQCQCLCTATKANHIAKSSAVLLVGLKRFSHNRGALTKNDKMIKYSEEFHLPLSDDSSIKYSLRSFVCHVGSSISTGHYMSFVKANRQWFRINDSQVNAISQLEAMSQKPYIMVFEKTASPSIQNVPTAMVPTLDDINHCLDALKSQDSTSVVASLTLNSAKHPEKCRITVTKHSLRTLRVRWMYKDANFLWLTDEVINAYTYLIANSQDSIFPLSSFVLDALRRKGGTKAVARNWYRQDSMFSFMKWIVPVHLGAHWAVMVVDFVNKVVYYSDSMSCSSCQPIYRLIYAFVEERYLLETHEDMDWTLWKSELCHDFPRQSNGYDCGVFALKAAQYLVGGYPVNYQQEDMSRFRLEMLYEILHGYVLSESQERKNPMINGAMKLCTQHKVSENGSESDVSGNADNKTAASGASKPSNQQKDDNGSGSLDRKPCNQQKDQKGRLQSLGKKNSIQHKDESGVLSKGRDDITVRQRKSEKKSQKSHYCAECKTYAHYASLYKHQRRVHQSAAANKKIECLEKNCSFHCTYVKQLREHLSTAHQIRMDKEVLLFKSSEEFQQWKSKYEMDNVTSFVQLSGEKIVQESRVTYYYCSRSGFFESRSGGMRSLKTQGSAKVDSYCTAGMLRKHLENGMSEVEVVKTHYGHECRLGHMKIPDEHKLYIAKQLAEGVSFDNLLDKVRDSVSTHLERIHLITRKDLSNIAKAFSVRQENRHSVDAVSVRLWVEEVKCTNDSPVLFYKAQGCDEATVGTNNGLCKHDFALVMGPTVTIFS